MINQLSINTIRVLGIDAINKANSGHPGIVLGAAPMAYTLYINHLNVNPEVPNWFNRDRFVLAAGHGSMLLYALLHLSGFNVSIEDLKEFRQLHSKTPGHPEYGHTEGVDATSGPLGQGIPMAVGMAMTERHLAAKYNKEGYEVIDHYTYCLCGDGDLMEGVTSEAASLAGHLKLGKLIVLYDSNDISLDGPTSHTFTEQPLAKFEAMGWHVEKVEDGTCVKSINQAINNAKDITDKPSLIEIRTVIGYGAPEQGTHKVHGAPLGEEGGTTAKTYYNWAHDAFNVPEEVYTHFKDTMISRGKQKFKTHQDTIIEYQKAFPSEYLTLMKAINLEPVDITPVLPTFTKADATRNASGECLNKIANTIPNLIGGAADLISSTKAYIKDGGEFTPKDYSRQNIFFGVREFAMGAILNGMALHGGVRVFGSTFFVFSDYFKPALRMAALMNLPTLYILTHDSVAVGEDGPTHQPVEQLAMLRSIPNVEVLRPCDANETAACYKLAFSNTTKPTILVLTRQSLPLSTSDEHLQLVEKGGYILREANGELDGILIASGSEVPLALEAQEALAKENIHVRVVNIVSHSRFNEQSHAYKEEVLPKHIRKRVAIEAASSQSWHQYVGLDGKVIGLDTFGASGKASEVLKYYGFTKENIIEIYKSI